MRYKVLKIVTVSCALFGFLPISLSTIKGKICIRQSRIWKTYQYLFALFYVIFAVELAIKGVESFQYNLDTWMIMLINCAYSMVLPGMLISLHIHRSTICKVLKKVIDLSSELSQKFWMKTAWSLAIIGILLIILTLISLISAFAEIKKESISIEIFLRKEMPIIVVRLSFATIFTLFTTVLSILSCHWDKQNLVLSRNIRLLKTPSVRFKEVANLGQIFGKSFGFINLLLVILMFTEFVFNFYYIAAVPCQPTCGTTLEWSINLVWLLCIVYLVVRKLKVTSNVYYESKRTCQILTQYDSLMDYEEKAEEFTMDCLHNPITFTCCGFFELNFSLLGKVLSAIATYTVIMVQIR